MHDVDAIAEALRAQGIFAHLPSRMSSSHEGPYHPSRFEIGTEKPVRVANRQVLEARSEVRRNYWLGALTRISLSAAVDPASSLGEGGYYYLQRIAYGVDIRPCDFYEDIPRV